MFSRRRDPGLWTFDSVITGAELEYWDAAIAYALDGASGGAYALDDDMTIGGNPGVEWTFDLPVTVADLFTATGDVYLGASSAYALVVESSAYFQAPVEFNDLVNFGPSNVTFGGQLFINDNVTVASGAFFNFDGAYFDGDVSFGANVEFHGGTVTIGASGADVLSVAATAQFNGGATFGGGATFTLPVSFSGAGKIKYRTKTIAVAGNQSVVAAHYDVVYVPSGLMSGTDVITIDDTFAEDGMAITFLTDDATSGTAIQTPAGLTLAIKNANGFPVGVTAYRIAGAWRYVWGDKS